jgi:hypothetical protein
MLILWLFFGAARPAPKGLYERTTRAAGPDSQLLLKQHFLPKFSLQPALDGYTKISGGLVGRVKTERLGLHHCVNAEWLSQHQNFPAALPAGSKRGGLACAVE